MRTSTKSTASTKSARTSTKSARTSTKSTRTSTKSTRTANKSTITSTKSSTTSFGLPEPQILTSTTTRLPSTFSTEGIVYNDSIVVIQENNLFCHPNCTGTFVGIGAGSLLGVVLVILAFIVATTIYNRRRQAKSDASLSNTRSDLSQSTTDITGGIENNYESNQTDAHVSVITTNRSTGTLMPSQTTRRNPPLDSNSNGVGPSRISDHIYLVMGPLAKQNPNPTETNPSRIYLELISDESDALPSSQPPAGEDHAYYNVGLNGSSLMSVDNIEYEITDTRVQPASSSASNSRSPRQKGGFCATSKTPTMASTSNVWNKAVIAKYDNVGNGIHR